MTARRASLAAALLCGAAALTACGSSTPGTAIGATTTAPPATEATTSGATTTSAPAESSCDYRETPGEPAAEGKDVGPPPAGDGPAKVTLVTNHGEIAMEMAVDDAPCTTASIGHLAKAGFYDGSPCHRMTKAASLSVLQCGDPSGKGTGGPGYTLPDENPTDLAPAGSAGYVTYPRGAVAMANTGQPHSGGSQFFLVYADSTLPPTYAVFATMDSASLAVLDKIAQGGVAGGGEDGAPALAVTVQQARAE